MENYDSLFENQPKHAEEKPAQQYDREAWIEQKRTQRQALYDTIDEMADKTLSDPSALSDYLNTQARLGKTSVANALLVTAQKPDATQLMSYDDWQQKGRSVKKGEKAIEVLEANGEYERPDGTMGINFDVKRVFDVSQTYGKPIRERSAPPIKNALKAIMTDSPVPIRLSDDVSQGVGALYSSKENAIEVARNLDGNDLFFAVSRELARAEQGNDTFLCDCAANIACLRYGVPAKHCDRIPDELASMEAREKRGALGMVREAACSITERVDRNLFVQRQKNQPER